MKLSKYRWIVLLSMLPILAMTNIFWLTFAPITNLSKEFYHVTPLSIAFLSMCYMIVYIVMALPASYIVDTKGFKTAMVIGAIVTALFGMLRGIYATNFTVVVIAQIGVAIGQPFLVNSITKAAASWFPVNERATATGIATMAGYIGMIIALILTPILTTRYGIEKMLLYYGYVAILCAIVFILFSKAKPIIVEISKNKIEKNKLKWKKEKANKNNIRNLLKNKDFVYLMICMFMVMGIFNGIMTWIEDILKPKGISSDGAGIIGGILVIVGLIGAVILPVISDKIRKRRPFLIWPILAAIPGFLGITFLTGYIDLTISSAIMGFFIMGMGPVAFQYGAEIAYPVPEGTSFGVLMLMGQISGIIFIILMDLLRIKSNGSMVISLSLFVVLLLISYIIVSKLKESELVLGLSSVSENDLDRVKVNKAKALLCSYGRKLLESGLVSGTWGNLSLRIDENFMIITPSGKEYEKLTIKDIVVVNINDLSYSGDIRPSGERALHAEMYKNRKDINACIHTHSLNASTVSASRQEVPALLDDMAQIIGPTIRVAEYALPGTAKLVKASARAIKGRNGILLANHGAVCVGRDLAEAFVASEILEKACKTFIEVQFLGGGYPIDRFEAKLMHEYYLRKYSKQK